MVGLDQQFLRLSEIVIYQVYSFLPTGHLQENLPLVDFSPLVEQAWSLLWYQVLLSLEVVRSHAFLLTRPPTVDPTQSVVGLEQPEYHHRCLRRP